ncbi:hypothetical protein QJS04_geneDACA019206 [Acorus gramineus]|uniref:DUF4408 domain-containing protein n=1 Tax=Acorus gramineus TaxID=55184 RepID=A0AAV9A000_ACOGR|nr:hypothetical protein QJS04_geneDACA019206 [Acorus gramineus]
MTTTRLQIAILTVKIAMATVGIITAVGLVKLATPYLLEFFLSTLPGLWTSFRGWLSPAFLYIIVNFIIITLAASSGFNQKPPPEKLERDLLEKQRRFNPPKPPPSETWPSLTVSGEYPTESRQEPPPPATDPYDSDVSCLTTVSPDPASSPESEAKTPAIRNTGKYSPEIRSRPSVKLSERRTQSPSWNRTAEVEEDDTLDATWRAISGGAHNARHLGKSDTWPTPPHVEAEPEPKPMSTGAEMRKSETFKEGSKVRREAALSQDELNRRAEAFIKNFNDMMRLERQESNQRYVDMVTRGY